MNKNDKPYPLAVATARRNVRLISRALDVSASHSQTIPAEDIEELRYLHDHLYGIVIRLESADEKHSVYDELFNDLLDLTLSLIMAYEKIWRQIPETLGDYLILSPGHLRGEVEMNLHEQELFPN